MHDTSGTLSSSTFLMFKKTACHIALVLIILHKRRPHHRHTKIYTPLLKCLATGLVREWAVGYYLSVTAAGLLSETGDGGVGCCSEPYIKNYNISDLIVENNRENTI